MPIGKERNKYLIQAKAPGTAIPRAFFVCFYGTRTEASCCYLFLSNHLQIQWQAIPAMTEIKNEINISNTSIPLFCCQIEGSNILNISQNVVYKKQKLEYVNMPQKEGIFWGIENILFFYTLNNHKIEILFFFSYLGKVGGRILKRDSRR